MCSFIFTTKSKFFLANGKKWDYTMGTLRRTKHMKYLNVNLIREKQRAKLLRTQYIVEGLGITLNQRYNMLNFTQRLPKSKVKILCEILGIKESEIYI